MKPTSDPMVWPDEVPTTPLFTREKIDTILDLVPHEARCCYTGQSILAYCPDPTFDWAEVNNWPDETDVDIFCYNKSCLASLVQTFIDHGWEPAEDIDKFKAERIRFWETPRKFNIQTVALSMPGMPNVNLTWKDDADNAVSTVQRFDMDYLMVGMDVRTRVFIDLRGKDHRVANVNTLNTKFDVDDVDVMYWLRQFDRIPKGYSRGIDTRPVAKTYLSWLDQTIERGDRGAGSKTRFYADRKMENSIKTVVESGFSQEMAEAMYHLFRREDSTWEATSIGLQEVRKTISEWLDSVIDD